MATGQKVTGVSLTEHETNIVALESKRRGLFNFSATLRMIIREWEEMKEQRVRITEAGRAALHEQGALRQDCEEK